MSLKPNTQKGVLSKSFQTKDPLYGTCKGRFAFLTLSADFVLSLLPRHLELAPQNYTSKEKHPVLLMFNDTVLEFNDDLARKAKELDIPIKLDYNEFIVMVPYVQFDQAKYNEEAPYCFLPVLYLDSLLAVLGGRVFWEFNKILTHFDPNPHHYEIQTEVFRHPLLSCEFTDSLSSFPGEGFKNFDAITPILELPVLEYGIWGYMTSRYRVGYQGEMITPFTLKMENQGSKYLPEGIFNAPSIIKNELGCFNLDYKWSLSHAKLIKL